ncbi:MAG: recombinase family protein [Actinomycetota bacterium]|nr:recombinase family protein [Actinomycetota bacterium]
MAETRRLDGYIRVSARGDREGAAFQSPLQQRQAIERWAGVHGVEIAVWHQDLDQSGGRMERPGLESILARVQAGRTGGVVVAWLDRFSRASVRDALRVVEEIRSHGARVVALDVASLDPDDPFGEYALTMMLAMSRMQLRRIADNWTTARRNAIARGVQTGPIPFGYRADAGRHLIAEPCEADVVRRIFERRARGHSPAEIARWLDEVAPRGGGRLWSRNGIRNLTANPTYLGSVRNGPYVNEHAHEAIVSPALWRQAQREPGVHPGRNPRMVLARVVRCSSCGHLMKGSVQNRTHRHIYRCSERFVSGACPRPLSVSEAPLAAEVLAQLLAPLARRTRTNAVWTSDVAAARAEVAQAERELSLCLELNLSSRAGVAAHQAALGERERRVAEAEDRLYRLLDAGDLASHDPDQLRADWPALAPEGRRAVLRGALDAVMVRAAKSRSRHGVMAERILVLYRGEAPAALRGVVRTTETWTWDETGRLCVRPADREAVRHREAQRARRRQLYATSR